MEGTLAPLTNSENQISQSTLFLIRQQTNSKIAKSWTEARSPQGALRSFPSGRIADATRSTSLQEALVGAFILKPLTE